MKDERHRILGRIAGWTFVTGIILAVIGVILVYFGSTGDIKIEFGKYTLETTNVGVASIFISAVLIIYNLRRIMDSFDKGGVTLSGKMAPGELRIDEVRVTQNFEKKKTCLVDFWVSNQGGSQVIITAIEFEVVDTARAELIKGAMKSSGDYDLDITEIRKAGQIFSRPISQEVKPGKSDRFRVIFKAEGLGLGVFAAWRLRPKLLTNYGNIEAAPVDIWLPFKDEDTTLEDLKGFEKMEKTYGQRKDPIPGAARNPKSNKEEKETLTGIKNQQPSYDELTNNFEQLIHVTEFHQFTEYLEKLPLDIRRKEEFKTFIKSEAFGKDVQRRFEDAVGAKDIALCLDCIMMTSEKAARNILSYRGFGLSLIPLKINEEEEIEYIGLCLAIIGRCDPKLLKLVNQSEDFDKEKFIEKINAENDLYMVGHTIERIWRDDPEFSRTIVESKFFNLVELIEKLKKEDSNDNVNECLGGIKYASPTIAEKLRVAL